MNRFQILKIGHRKKAPRKKVITRSGLRLRFPQMKHSVLSSFDEESLFKKSNRVFTGNAFHRIIDEKKNKFLEEWAFWNMGWTTPVYPKRSDIVKQVRNDKAAKKLRELMIKQQERLAFGALYPLVIKNENAFQF